MTHSPHRVRKARLEALLKPKVPSLMYLNHFKSDSELLFKSVGLPLVAKRQDSFYQPGVRSTDWVKVERTDAVLSEHGRGSVGVAETG